MASTADRMTFDSTDASPWWRQRWATILGGFALAFVVGIGCATLTKSFGGWHNGDEWERALMIRMHTPLPAAIDTLMLVFPWFGTNISLIPAIALICGWLWRRGDKHLSVRL